MSVARSALDYESRLIVKDAPALAAMSILSAQYPRYGYRRIHVFLERQGHRMSIDRAWRLWRRAKLQVPKKRSRKRVALARPRPQAPLAAGQVWAYDFVFDACANGQQLKCLTVIDEHTRECLAIDVAGTRESIASVTKEKLQAAYDENYVAARMSFVACGDFTDNQVKTILRQARKLSDQYLRPGKIGRASCRERVSSPV